MALANEQLDTLRSLLAAIEMSGTWQHINLTVDYLWIEPTQLDKGGCRILKARSERLTT